MKNTGLHFSNIYSIPMPPSLSDQLNGGCHHAAVPESLRCLLRILRTGTMTTQTLRHPKHPHGNAPPLSNLCSHSLQRNLSQRHLLLIQNDG